MSRSSAVRLLQVFDPSSGVQRRLVLYTGMEMAEVDNLLRVSFPQAEGKALIGLRDPVTKTVYPTSVLSLDDSPLLPNVVYEAVLPLRSFPPGTSTSELKRSKSQASLPQSTVTANPTDNEDDEDDDDDDFGYQAYNDEGGDDDDDEEDGEERETSLSLEENIDQIRFITGIDNVGVDAALSLLPISTRSMDEPFPLSVSRDEFAEMFAVLKSLVPQSKEQLLLAAESRDFVHVLFDVLASPSTTLFSETQTQASPQQQQEISTTSLASGLSLLCGGDVKDNLRSIFSLFEDQLDWPAGKRRPAEGGGIPDEAVYLHLCSLFRIVYQLCGYRLRQRASFTAEELAAAMADRMLRVVPRRFGSGVLSFSEFYACAVTGLQNGLIAFHKGGDTNLPDNPPFERFSPLKENVRASQASMAVLGGTRASLFSDASSANASELDDDYDDVRDYDDGDVNDDDNMASMEDSLVAASLVDYEGGPLPIPRAARLLGLLKFSPDEMFTALKYIIDEDAQVSLASYQRFMGQLIGRHYQQLSVLQRAVVDHVISQVFEVYDYEDSGVVRASQLSWALLLFCGGTNADKASVASDMLRFFKEDTTSDDDTDVSADDMAQCLTSLLKAVRGLDPHFLGELSPYDVGLELTMNAFQHAGVSWHDNASQGMKEDKNNKMLDLQSFEHWFAVVLAQVYTMSSDEDYTPNTSQTSQTSNAYETSSAASVASSQGMFDQEERWGQRVFDSDDNVSSSKDSTASGSAWSRTPKYFNNFPAAGLDRRKPPLTIDTDFTEETTEDDDEFEFEPNSSDTMQVGVSPPADFASSEDLYADADADVDADGPSAIVLELRQARMLLGLEGYPAEDLMETLGERAKGGVLSYSAWLETLHWMTQLAGRTSSREALQLGRKVFDAFTPIMRHSEPCVVFAPFVAGLSSLCSSPPEEKFAVAFALVDGDSDGHITGPEFNTLVLSYLRVVSACSTIAECKLGEAKVSLELLSTAVVKEAQRTCGPGVFSRETVSEIVVDCLELSAATAF